MVFCNLHYIHIACQWVNFAGPVCHPLGSAAIQESWVIIRGYSHHRVWHVPSPFFYSDHGLVQCQNAQGETHHTSDRCLMSDRLPVIRAMINFLRRSRVNANIYFKQYMTMTMGNTQYSVNMCKYTQTTGWSVHVCVCVCVRLHSWVLYWTVLRKKPGHHAHEICLNYYRMRYI